MENRKFIVIGVEKHYECPCCKYYGVHEKMGMDICNVCYLQKEAGFEIEKAAGECKCCGLPKGKYDLNWFEGEETPEHYEEGICIDCWKDKLWRLEKEAEEAFEERQRIREQTCLRCEKHFDNPDDMFLPEMCKGCQLWRYEEDLKYLESLGDVRAKKLEKERLEKEAAEKERLEKEAAEKAALKKHYEKIEYRSKKYHFFKRENENLKELGKAKNRVHEKLKKSKDYLSKAKSEYGKNKSQKWVAYFEKKYEEAKAEYEKAWADLDEKEKKYDIENGWVEDTEKVKSESPSQETKNDEENKVNESQTQETKDDEANEVKESFETKLSESESQGETQEAEKHAENEKDDENEGDKPNEVNESQENLISGETNEISEIQETLEANENHGCSVLSEKTDETKDLESQIEKPKKTNEKGVRGKMKKIDFKSHIIRRLKTDLPLAYGQMDFLSLSSRVEDVLKIRFNKENQEKKVLNSLVNHFDKLFDDLKNTSDKKLSVNYGGGAKGIMSPKQQQNKVYEALMSFLEICVEREKDGIRNAYISFSRQRRQRYVKSDERDDAFRGRPNLYDDLDYKAIVNRAAKLKKAKSQVKVRKEKQAERLEVSKLISHSERQAFKSKCDHQNKRL